MNFNVPPVTAPADRNGSRITHVGAIILFRSATGLDLRSCKWIVENNLSQDDEGKHFASDVGNLIKEWYSHTGQ